MVQCVVPTGQLIDIDVFTRPTTGLMDRLSWAILGSELPKGAVSELLGH